MVKPKTLEKFVYCLGTLEGVKKCTPENSPKYYLLDKVITKLDEVLKELQC